ncbi:MAG: multicopper oxidase domain-containing protein, partial [Nitrospinae bacterium]|nr:multicopper oxidase domain-containing protein [Nitrospinota bacterium]
MALNPETAGEDKRLVRGVWGVLGAAIVIAMVAVIAHAHPSQDLAPALPQGDTKSIPGATLPGAVNLGLAGQGLREGSYAATVLEPQLRQRLQTGAQQGSGAAHFGGNRSEDIILAAQSGESVKEGTRCPAQAPVRSFDLAAVPVEITLNQYLDFYAGFTFVLSDNVAKVRAEEKRTEAARRKKRAHDPGAVSTGLQGDAIQPLVIRANQGDCLRLTLRNQIEEEEVSFHLHGSGLVVKGTGKAAVLTNPDIYVKPGTSQSFEWYIRPEEPEGAHQFHSHGRTQTALGLMGTLVVEPRGTRFLDPFSGEELKSGWMAMIEDPTGPDFREFVVVYHEVGDEEFRILNKQDDMILQRDPDSGNYRPASRSLNYRSESFFNNLVLQKQRFGIEDESLGYSAYTFGDPATPIPRSYLGDPAKWRLVHGGSEVVHSHHLHGGAIRWRRQPNLQADLQLFGKSNFTLAAEGPVKYPPVRTTSDRVDVQSLTPSEVFNKEIECGSGGCQHTAGDFLYHCHIPQHYVAGMW